MTLTKIIAFVTNIVRFRVDCRIRANHVSRISKLYTYNTKYETITF